MNVKLLDVKSTGFGVVDAECTLCLCVSFSLSLSFSFIDATASLMAMLAVQVYHGKLDFVCVDTPRFTKDRRFPC